jgi:hypothetical protein
MSRTATSAARHLFNQSTTIMCHQARFSQRLFAKHTALTSFSRFRSMPLAIELGKWMRSISFTHSYPSCVALRAGTLSGPIMEIGFAKDERYRWRSCPTGVQTQDQRRTSAGQHGSEGLRCGTGPRGTLEDHSRTSFLSHRPNSLCSLELRGNDHTARQDATRSLRGLRTVRCAVHGRVSTRVCLFV